MISEKGNLFLEIYELRGVPWRGDENRIDVFYSPLDFHFGDGCPGNTPVARGECAYRAGQYTVAAVEFRRALAAEGRRVAAVRLGDIALRNQDPVAAAGWYQAAGRVGGFGRLAAARLCELSGTCFGKQRPYFFDSTALAEPLHTEMLLRAARVAAYLGELPQAMLALRQAIDAAHGGCDGSTQVFCRELLLKVLEEPGKNGAVEALDTYLALPGRLEGPLAFTLVRAAAQKAAELGARVFAGNLMAASVQAVEATAPGLAGRIPASHRGILPGGRRTHARARGGRVCRDTPGPRQASGPRWNAVLKAMEGSDDELASSVGTRLVIGEATRDLALAYTAIARATNARLSAEAADDVTAEAP